MRLALAAVLVAPATLMAQPTPEGTTITNTATASWTDANGNTYTPVTASATVTVGYLVAVDVQGTSPVTVASPSTTNWQSYTIHNGGNGTDSVKHVSASITAGGSVTGYRIGATIYADTAALNLALSGMAIAANADLLVEVRYDIAPGQGGTPITLTLTATSSRQPTGTGSSDSFPTVLNPAVAAAVSVSPDVGTFDRLPSNGTNYSQVFVVANNGNATDNFTLTASTSSGGAATVGIVSVNGAAGTGSSVSIASGATASITVVYSVANVAAGGADSLRLLATSTADGTKSDFGAVQVRVVRAALTILKEPYRDNQSVLIGATDRVLPNEFIQYKLTVTNTGGAAASSVSITDPLAAALTYVSAAGDTPADWSITTPGGVVTANLTSGPLAAGASRFIWVRVQVR
jgi:uncharacterized repeat protein (TIGR01451 family)